MDGYGEAQPVQLGAVVMAFRDVHRHKALAVAVGWFCIEIAGATESAITVLDPLAFQSPVRGCHFTLPGFYPDKTGPGIIS
jgi:hypothetical protein